MEERALLDQLPDVTAKRVLDFCTRELQLSIGHATWVLSDAVTLARAIGTLAAYGKAPTTLTAAGDATPPAAPPSSIP